MKNSFKSLQRDKSPQHIKGHPLKSAPRQNKLRQEIAVEAARLMTEEGLDSIPSARKKAARQFGVPDECALPDDHEVLFQMQIHQSLYQSSAQKQSLKDLRTTALNAMKLFKSFKPGLIGSVLLGYAHKHSRIDLLLRADSAEEIAILLMSHDIAYKLQDWTLYFSRSKDSGQSVPAYQFYADQHKINLIILTEQHRKMTPLNPDNWQTIQKASTIQVENLLEN